VSDGPEDPADPDDGDGAPADPPGDAASGDPPDAEDAPEAADDGEFVDIAAEPDSVLGKILAVFQGQENLQLTDGPIGKPLLYLSADRRD